MKNTLCIFHVHNMSHSLLSKANSIHITILKPYFFKIRFSVISPPHTVIPRGLFPAYIQPMPFHFSKLMLLLRPV